MKRWPIIAFSLTWWFMGVGILITKGEFANRYLAVLICMSLSTTVIGWLFYR